MEGGKERKGDTRINVETKRRKKGRKTDRERTLSREKRRKYTEHKRR